MAGKVVIVVRSDPPQHGIGRRGERPHQQDERAGNTDADALDDAEPDDARERQQSDDQA